MYQPIDIFRKTTSFLYREIGILQPSNHVRVNDKRSDDYSFFSNQRKNIARELYHKTEQENDPRAVLAPYEKVTGLTLEDIHRAFDEGDWRAGGGRIFYGGPKWASITAKSIALRDALIEDDEESA